MERMYVAVAPGKRGDGGTAGGSGGGPGGAGGDGGRGGDRAEQAKPWYVDASHPASCHVQDAPALYTAMQSSLPLSKGCPVPHLKYVTLEPSIHFHVSSVHESVPPIQKKEPLAAPSRAVSSAASSAASRTLASCEPRAVQRSRASVHVRLST